MAGSLQNGGWLFLLKEKGIEMKRNYVRIVQVFVFLSLTVPMTPTFASGPDQIISGGIRTKWNPGHYVYIRLTRSKPNISEKFVAGLNRCFVGVQVILDWRTLEPKKDRYDFRKIEEFLSLLSKYDKRLWLQISERIYRDERPLPHYLYNDPEYQGGAAPLTVGGSVAKIWIPAVRERFELLIQALGKRFDKRYYFEGVNFPETWISVDRQAAPDFDMRKYAQAMLHYNKIARQSFPHCPVIQYVSFGGKDQQIGAFIKQLYQIGVGLGGPDLVPDNGRYPNRPRIRAYSFYPMYAGKMPLGTAVQRPNFTKKKGVFTMEGFWNMAIDTLRLNYVFWADVEGREFTHSFSKDIAPYIKNKNCHINKGWPENLKKLIN